MSGKAPGRGRGGPADLAYFGQVTAGLSHELKNVLATINELSGLQEDLLQVAGAGRPLDPERLTNLGKRVRAQVSRGEDLLTSLNRFAHSVDRDAQEVEPAALLGVSLDLCQRMLRLRRATLDSSCLCDPGPVVLSPFAFHRLLSLSMEALLEGAPDGQQVRVTLRRAGPAVQASLALGGGSPLAALPDRLQQAAQEAGAELALEGGDRRLLFTLSTRARG